MLLVTILWLLVTFIVWSTIEKFFKLIRIHIKNSKVHILIFISSVIIAGYISNQIAILYPNFFKTSECNNEFCVENSGDPIENGPRS
jgi:hypothetical protein